MHRRKFLVTAGAATLVAASGEIWLACEAGSLRPLEGAAYSAWSQWSRGGEPGPIRLLRSAVLASSPHNTQPWRFRVTPSRVELYLDAKRSVAGLDPYLREAHIGMGCALENLLLAAAANGYSANVSWNEGSLEGNYAESSLRQVAWVELSTGTPHETALYKAIPDRHTNRSLYDPAKPLPANFASQLLAACDLGPDIRMFLVSDQAERRLLTSINSAANTQLYSDPKVESGSEQWIRWRDADIRKYQDGLTVDNFGLSPFMTAVAKSSPLWLLHRAASPSSRKSIYEKQMLSAQLMSIIAVRDRLDRRQSLLAGQMWQRAHLFATTQGVAAHPGNEAIEMIDYEKASDQPAKRMTQLQQLIGNAVWQPTFLFLLGYPTLPAHLSPRRPAETVQLA